MTLKLNQTTACRAAEVINAVQDRQKVRLLRSDGNILEGTLRAVTPAEDNPNFLPWDVPLDNAWVRVTSRGGWEVWVPFAELLNAVGEHTVAFG
jgi:hypothetical protein